MRFDPAGFAAGLGTSGRLCLASIALAGLLSGCGGSNGDSVGTAATTNQARHLFGETAREIPTCGGADLSAAKSFIHVSSQGADGDGCGQTTGTACKTIQQGIERCAAGGCAVLVRHGLYPTSATIELRDAVSVYGGCLFDGEPDRKYRTTIQASPAPGTPAINANAIDSPTTVHGLVVMGKNESAGGAPSIAMSVNASKGLTLTNSVLIGGKGGDGAGPASSNGAPGGDGSEPACPTCRGAAGAACPSNPPPAGVGGGGPGAGQNAIQVSGLCIGNCTCSTGNGADSVGMAGQDSGSAKGGAGSGPGSSGCSCLDRPSAFGTVNPGDGAPGNPGASGQCGTQGGFQSGLIWGQPSTQGTGWLPSSGGAGTTANVGAGGGGGGSGGYASNAGANDLSGHPGSGGGGGGCGGPGGLGGQQGGASLALVLSNASVPGAASQNSIVPGVGGQGGRGAPGGIGGPGGKGGPSSAGPRFSYLVVLVCEASRAPGAGGAGGAGGQGGAGSGGAGGNGGPSIGIALRGDSPTPPGSSGVYLGTPGAGGAPGNGGVNPHCTGAAGATGARGGSAAVFQLDQPLASMLFPGVQLAKGQSLFSPGSKAFLSMQGDDNLCLYAPAGNPRWCTNTVGQGVPAALMQTDGNFCVYPANGSPVCSGTAGHPNASLIVQDSGTVQIVDEGVVLWSRP